MRSKTLLAIGISGLSVQPASAASFVFHESGFTDGATVSGFFTGQDLDGDGEISSFEGEVSGFGAKFSGNSLVDAFSLGFSDLYALVYDLDGTIGNGTGEGIIALGGTSVFGVGPFGSTCGSAAVCGVVASVNLDLSPSFAQVTSAPEPATWALMITGFGGVGAMMRRRRRASPNGASPAYA